MSKIINPFISFPAGGFDKTSLVAWYDLETDGSDSHASLDLTENNTPTYTTSSGGKIGEAVDLDDASSESLSHADNAAFDVSGALTLFAWVKTDADPSTTKTIIAKTVSSQNAYSLVIRSNEKARFTLSGDGSSSLIIEGTTVTDTGTWYFVCGTFEPSTAIRIWVNGVNEATNTTSIPASIHNSTAPFFIGAQGSSAPGSFFFPGMIDSAGLFARLLSAAEITTLYNSGSGLAYSDL